MMDDQDVAFNLFNEDNNYDLYKNMLEHATNPDSDDWRNPPESTFLMRSLLKNTTFKNDFVTRYESLLATTFAPANVKALINQMKAVIEPKMPRHIKTWGDAGPDYTTIQLWNDNIDVMIDFAENRPAIAKEHLKGF